MLRQLWLILGLWLSLTCSFAADNDSHTSRHSVVPTTASATFDADGKLYVVIPRDDFIWLRTSKDFGKTFSDEVKVNAAPEKVYADGDNRPKIAIVNPNELAITYTQPLEKPWTGHIRLIRSIDGGKNFEVPITVNDNQDIISHRFDSLLARDGKIWVSWLDKSDLAIAKKNGKPQALVIEVLKRHGYQPESTYQFADSYVEQIRYDIDKRWMGELPRTYFLRGNQTKAVSGVLTEKQLNTWTSTK